MTRVDETNELEIRLHLQSRAFEGIVDLLRSLGNTLELEKVARLSLLTIVGQLLVQRAALYLPSGGNKQYKLCEVVGIPRIDMPDRIPRCELMDEAMTLSEGAVEIKVAWDLEETIIRNFEYAAQLHDANSPVALLLLGGRMPGRRLDEGEENLLNAMGLVIGTMVQRALTYEHMKRAKLKMEEADRLRRVILDHVSHEFNTPLMVAKSAVELARSATPDKQAELFEMHQEAVDRLGVLLQSLLRAADSDNETPTELLSMSLPRFISDVVNPLVYELDLEGFHIVEGHWPEPEVFVRVDPAKFKAALEGLLHNAHRFSRPEYPWAAVHCYPTSYHWWSEREQVERLPMYREILDGNPDKRMEPIFDAGETPPPGPHPVRDMAVVIEVIDSGIGIPQSEHDFIFQPFAQASNSPWRGVRGAGMGLASCRRMIKDCGGELQSKSVEGEGSIFAILLPASWGRP